MSQNPSISRVQTHFGAILTGVGSPSKAIVDLVAPDAQDLADSPKGDIESGTRRLARLLTGETAREQREPSL